MSVNTPGVRLRDTASTLGKMVTLTLANFSTGKRMAKVTGRKVVLNIQISILESTEMTKSMDSVNFSGSLDRNTKETTFTTKSMVMVKCTGLTVAFTEAFGRMASKPALVS